MFCVYLVVLCPWAWSVIFWNRSGHVCTLSLNNEPGPYSIIQLFLRYRKSNFIILFWRITLLLINTHCPASPEKEDQRAAGSPAALTQLALCLRLAPDLKGRKLATRRNPQ